MAEPVQFLPNKVEVEPDVMGHKDGVLRDVEHILSYVGKNRGIPHHIVGDARQVADKGWNRATRIQQRVKRIDNLLPIVAEDGNFGQAGGAFYAPRSFDVNDAIHDLKIRQKGQKSARGLRCNSLALFHTPYTSCAFFLTAMPATGGSSAGTSLSRAGPQRLPE